MNSSITNVFPKPAPPPPAPVSESSTPPAPVPANNGFTQQLNKAKSKTAPAPQPAPAAPPSNTAAKKTNANSAQNKNNSKSQSDQSNTPEPTSDSDADAPDADSTDTLDLSQAAEATANSSVPAQTSVAKVLVIAASTPAPASSKTLSAKTASAKANQSSAQTQDSTNTDTPANTATNTDSANTPAQQIAAGSATQQLSNPHEDSTLDDGEKPDSSTEPENTAPVKAKVVAVQSPTQTADQVSSDSPNSPAATDSLQTFDDARPTDFGTALQSAAQALPELAPASTPMAHASQTPVGTAASPPSPVAQFASANQPAIVSTIHGSLLPNGGTMNISLNPPDLGAMQITVKMEAGTMSASFQTSNDEATRLLTHSLGQLKSALEGQGVAVDRLHVHQVSSSETTGGKGDESENRDSSSGNHGAQQEEQRRQALRKMWRRARGERDPLDLVA